MADYIEEQRVKQRYPHAYCRYLTAEQSFLGYQICDPSSRVHGYYFAPLSRLELTEIEAWADASRRLGNEFVDEVGPLAERKEG